MQVEDDDFSSMVVCTLLKQIRAEYTCAVSGEDCVARWDGQSEDAPFDVVRPASCPHMLAASVNLGVCCWQVLLDWELGEGMSGLDVLKHIRERRAAGTDRCTVIIVSGNEPTPEERDAFLQTGADKYWVKPITAKQIQTLSLPASSA